MSMESNSSEFPGISADTRVLVTGAGSGIGLTIAKSFLERGAKVHICDVSTDALAIVSADHPEISTSETDVSEYDAVEVMFDMIAETLGGLDVLVNNVGISGPTAPLEEVSPEDWRHTVAVDLHSQFYCSKKAIPMLLKNPTGSIVNMSSHAGVFGCPLRSPYTASKWATIGLTKTLAMELGPKQIRVNAIAPGCVAGPRIEGVIERDASSRGISAESVKEAYQKQTSMRTFVSAQDVANMILFICSDLGRNISGQVLGIDGHTETLSQI